MKNTFNNKQKATVQQANNFPYQQVITNYF